MEDKQEHTAKFRISGLVRLMIGPVVILVIAIILHLIDESSQLEAKLKQSLEMPRQVYFYGAKGDPHFMVGLTGIGPEVALADANGQKRAEVVIRVDITELRLFDEVGELLAVVEGREDQSLIHLHHPEVKDPAFSMGYQLMGPGTDLLKDYAQLQVSAMPEAEGSYALVDKDKNVRVLLNDNDVGPEIILYDAEGRTTARLSLNEGQTQIELMDQKIRRRAHVKAVDQRSWVEIYNPFGKKRLQISAHDEPMLTLFNDSEEVSEQLSLAASGTHLQILHFLQEEVAFTKPVLFGEKPKIEEAMPVPSLEPRPSLSEAAAVASGGDVAPSEEPQAPEVKAHIVEASSAQPTDTVTPELVEDFEPTPTIKLEEVVTESKTPIQENPTP